MKPTTVDKALTILDLLIEHPEGLRPVELTQQTGYPDGTLHRLLNVLTRNEFVRRESNTSRYMLGYKFLRAFNRMVGGLHLQRKALPHLTRLAQTTGQAANLGVLRWEEMVFLESIVADTGGPVMYSPPGTLAPPHCTALGKVLLAYLPHDELEDHLHPSRLAARTPNSITSMKQLTDHLARVRECGYAIDDEEYNIGVRCVAAPVRDRIGRVVAAMSVSAPAHELPPERLPTIINLVVEAGQATSADLGYDVVASGNSAA